MDILKTATEWAKDEVFSAQFFIFFGILFLLGSVGFWQMGKTELAKAYKAISVTTIAMMIVIIMIDTNSYTRYVDYHEQLLLVDKENKH